MSNPTRFNITSDFASLKQITTVSGSISISGSNTVIRDITIPNTDVIARTIVRPSNVGQWFVGNVAMNDSGFTWTLYTRTRQINRTTLRFMASTGYGSAPATTFDYRISIFISPFTDWPGSN